MEKRKCKCLYCSLVCKNCGKWDGMEVNIAPQFSIINTKEDNVDTVRGSIIVTGRCKHCGTEIDVQQKRSLRTHMNRIYNLKKHCQVPIQDLTMQYTNTEKVEMYFGDSKGNYFHNVYELRAYKAGKAGDKIDFRKRKW